MELFESKLGIWLELWLWFGPDARSCGFIVFGKIEISFWVSHYPYALNFRIDLVSIEWLAMSGVMWIGVLVVQPLYDSLRSSSVGVWHVTLPCSLKLTRIHCHSSPRFIPTIHSPRFICCYSSSLSLISFTQLPIVSYSSVSFMRQANSPRWLIRLMRLSLIDGSTPSILSLFILQIESCC